MEKTLTVMVAVAMVISGINAAVLFTVTLDDSGVEHVTVTLDLEGLLPADTVGINEVDSDYEDPDSKDTDRDTESPQPRNPIRPQRIPKLVSLFDQYDEETVLQMIPEDVTKIDDFIDKFENPNKVVDTLYILEKKGKITASQGCMRKVTIAKTDNPDSPGPLNTWTCGMCGIKFKAQIPYEDYSGHAICKNCWKKLVES